MAHVYMLRGASGRFYIGATENLEGRVNRHNSGMVYSSRRLGLPLQFVGSQEYESMEEALQVERRLKRWKNPSRALKFLIRKE